MIGDFAEGDGPAEFASPACFMHEVDPSYSGLGATSPELQRSAILRWRKSERQRLIVQRLGISSRDGIRCVGDIAVQLDALLPDLRVRFESSKKPHAIGMGYSQAAITTIYPLPHHIPMDMIVTEERIAE